MTRQRCIASLLCLFVLIGIPGMVFGGNLSLDKVTVRYGPIPDVQLVAHHLGWFEKDLGIKIDWRTMNGGAATIAALQSGGMDIGCGVGTPPIAAAASQGIPLRIFWIQDNAAEDLAVRPPIKTFQDLKGKKIAALVGSTMYFALAVALEKEGMSTKDLKVIDLPIAETVAAYKRGDIDGAVLPHPMVDALYEMGATTLMSPVDRAEKYGYSLFDSCVCLEDWAKKHGDVLTEWVKVEEKAIQFTRQNENEAVEALAEALQLDKEVARNGLKSATHPSAAEQLEKVWLGKPGEKGSGVAKAIEITAAFQKNLGRIPKMPNDIDAFVDSSHIVNSMK